MNIKCVVKKLIRQYETNDPFVIAKSLGIILNYSPLKSVFGFYSAYKRIHVITINENLPSHLMNFVCAHELGHYFLHRGHSTPFLKSHTAFVTNKYEREANEFATELLCPDPIFIEYVENGYSVQEVAESFHIPIDSAYVKLNNFKN